MYPIRFGEDLVKGDMMIVATDSRLEIGWFLGRGYNGTVQYFALDQLAWFFDQYEKFSDEKKEKCKKPNVYYVNSPSASRFAKITEESITNEEDKIKYKKAIKTLIRLNIIN